MKNQKTNLNVETKVSNPRKKKLVVNLAGR